MKKGAFILVLHSHIPYVRKHGKWPHGEETLYEVMAETYIPLLNVLNELIKEGYHPRITIGLTPILLEQLSDKYINREFLEYLSNRIDACKEDIRTYSGPGLIADPADRLKHQDIARMYLEYYQKILVSYTKTYKKNIVKEFKRLQDKGILDIITSSATHAYLPLMKNDKNVNEQIKVGVKTYEKYFGKRPTGMWLPECGYRPEKDELPGLEEYLEEMRIEYFFTDGNVFMDEKTRKAQKADFVGPYKYNFGVNNDAKIKGKKKDILTNRPYKIAKSKVSVFARDEKTSLQVWSGEFGYPGDYWYREFHAKDFMSGLRYCRITHHNGLADKELYDPIRAQERVREHADHFAQLVEDRVNEMEKESGKFSSIVAAYDTELFGHWWFEGVDWLKQVLKRIESSNNVELYKADDYIKLNPADQSVIIPESSWGAGGEHKTWLNDDTEWLWPIIKELSDSIEKASKDFPNAKGVKKDILNQALRELLLLHSSDWPFLISTLQAKEYAIERFLEHKERCQKLLYLAYNKQRLNKSEKEYVEKAKDDDNPFKNLDYTKFGEKY